jgi:hypothetical protein
MKNITLTEAQKTALRAVSPSRFQTARIIGANPSALRALARKGLVQSRWAEGSIRRDGTWSYRITGKGLVELRKLNRTDTNDIPGGPILDDQEAAAIAENTAAAIAQIPECGYQCGPRDECRKLMPGGYLCSLPAGHESVKHVACGDTCAGGSHALSVWEEPAATANGCGHMRCKQIDGDCEKYNEPRTITAIPSGRDRHGNPIARRTYVIDRRPEPFGNGNSRIFFQHKSRLDGIDHFIPHVVVTDSIEFEPKPTASNLTIGQRVVITYADADTFHGEVYEIGHDTITVTNGKTSRQARPDQVSPA